MEFVLELFVFEARLNNSLFPLVNGGIIHFERHENYSLLSGVEEIVTCRTNQCLVLRARTVILGAMLAHVIITERCQFGVKSGN